MNDHIACDERGMIVLHLTRGLSLLQVPAPWLTSSAAVEGPERSPPRQRDRRSLSPPRRRHKNFHHVAPPKRLRTARAFLHLSVF